MTSKLRQWTKSTMIPSVVVAILVTLLLVIYLWQFVLIIVRSGEAGVLYKLLGGGTVVDYVYPEGFHAIFPWDTMTIYNTRVQTILHDFSVLTNRGLPVSLRLAIRFRPEYELLGVLHQNVGPDYVNTIIIPQIESVLRKNIGHLNPEDIYVNKEGTISSIILKALEEAGQKYVIVDDIIIRNVSLPAPVSSAIEEKLVQEQLYQAYDFKLKKELQEAERKRIEAAGIRDYNEIVAKTLEEKLLTWKGIEATLELSTSANSKVVVIGASKDGLPIILGTDR
ncbi:MAG: hypothetical protein BWK79_06550 [Beggiatoa sp. IS2]|nr:MAG: hypothetical protein BWK79_06550 [Beggiatoa sp. IS2]